MASAPPILLRPQPAHRPATPPRQADLPTPVLRHGSPPAQRVLPLRRVA